MFEQTIALAKKFVPILSRGKKPIRVMAEAIVIAPSRRQEKIKATVEPALLRMCEIALELDTLAKAMNDVGVPVGIRPDLRRILEKMGHARKIAAYEIYVAADEFVPSYEASASI